MIAAHDKRVVPTRSLLTAALVACALATALATALALSGCQASDQATGASFSAKTTVQLSTFDQAAATGENGALVDSSHAGNGYVGVSATAGSRLKAQVISGQETTNYDLAQDGTATIRKMSQLDTFRI